MELFRGRKPWRTVSVMFVFFADSFSVLLCKLKKIQFVSRVIVASYINFTESRNIQKLLVGIFGNF